MASENVFEFSDQNFEDEVLKAKGPVLVDFWAEWCGPCRMIAPIIDEIAKENTGKLKVGKVDVDKNAQLATQYGIQSIPTMMVFVDGEVKESMMGALPKPQIMQRLTRYIEAG